MIKDPRSTIKSKGSGSKNKVRKVSIEITTALIFRLCFTDQNGSSPSQSTDSSTQVY